MPDLFDLDVEEVKDNPSEEELEKTKLEKGEINNENRKNHS